MGDARSREPLDPGPGPAGLHDSTRCTGIDFTPDNYHRAFRAVRQEPLGSGIICFPLGRRRDMGGWAGAGTWAVGRVAVQGQGHGRLGVWLGRGININVLSCQLQEAKN